jgi:hypothetical protein
VITWTALGAIVVLVFAYSVVVAMFRARRAERAEAMLPDLDPKECQEIGWQMGEAHVLPSQWDAVWEAECLLARQKKAKRMRLPGETDQQFTERVAEFNRLLSERRLEPEK